MTGYRRWTTSWSTATPTTATSSGAPWWRKPMPSEHQRQQILLKLDYKSIGVRFMKLVQSHQGCGHILVSLTVFFNITDTFIIPRNHPITQKFVRCVKLC